VQTVCSLLCDMFWVNNLFLGQVKCTIL